MARTLVALVMTLVPLGAVAQDQIPGLKEEIVTIHAVSGAYKVQGRTTPDQFILVQPCGRVSVAESDRSARLRLTLELEGTPNQPLESLIKDLRAAVVQSTDTAVNTSGEAGRAVLIAWAGVPEFRGVIIELSQKYTLFLADGTPVRAVVSVELKEASALTMKKKTDPQQSPCP